MYKLVYKNLTEIKLLMAMGTVVSFYFVIVICTVKYGVGLSLVPLEKMRSEIGMNDKEKYNKIRDLENIISPTSSFCFFKRKGLGNNIHGTAVRADRSNRSW